MSQKHENRKRKRPSLPLLGLLLILSCGLCLGGFTAARYVLDWAKTNQLAKADRFYFTSDKLEEKDYPLYRLTVPSAAGAEISFELRNYADDVRFSEADVTYTITSSETPTSITGGDDTLLKGGKSSQIVTLKGFKFTDNKVFIDVTATSAPYSTTLGARFELYLPVDGLSYKVYDAEGTSALTMILTTGSKSGDVVIECPEGVYPDRTNSKLQVDTSGDITTCTFFADSDAEYNLTFFKADPAKTYTSSFTVNGENQE